jgi:hypothetical protein
LEVHDEDVAEITLAADATGLELLEPSSRLTRQKWRQVLQGNCRPTTWPSWRGDSPQASGLGWSCCRTWRCASVAGSVWHRRPLGSWLRTPRGPSDLGCSSLLIAWVSGIEPECGAWPRWCRARHGRHRSGCAWVDGKGKACAFAPAGAWCPWSLGGQSYCRRCHRYLLPWIGGACVLERSPLSVAIG